MATHKQEKKKARIHLALAASVAFGIGVTMNFFQFSSAYDQLSDHALAHVYNEMPLLDEPVDNSLTLASLNKQMATFGGSFNDLFSGLISADFCRFDGMKSLHLVFQGEESPITVFVIPHTEELKVNADFADENFYGRTIQFRNSNIVVVSDKMEEVEQFESKINQNIRWSI